MEGIEILWSFLEDQVAGLHFKEGHILLLFSDLQMYEKGA
jgi:hypothetical protein